MSMIPLESHVTKTLAHLVTGQLHPDQVGEEQWVELIELSLTQNLGGMLLRSLRQMGWVIPGDCRWQPLLDTTRRKGIRSLKLEKVRNQAAKAFDRANIPAIWLKGSALAYTYYPEPHLRPMDDLDILIPPERVSEARAALHLLGFRRAKVDFAELGGFKEQARHHDSLTDRSGQVKLELHFRLLVPNLHHRLDDGLLDWFWEQTEERSINGPSFRVLKPEANLLYLCAHAILQHPGEHIDLLHLLDLHLLVTQSRFDWNLVVERAAALHWTYAVETALEMLPALFGTPLPEDILNDLRMRRPADERLPANLGSGHRTRRWEEWLGAFWSMTPGKRLRLVWITLFPSGDFLRQQYRLSQRQLLLPYYLYHFLDGGREVVRALRHKTTHS